jgi:hypothetical protein
VYGSEIDYNFEKENVSFYEDEEDFEGELEGLVEGYYINNTAFLETRVLGADKVVELIKKGYEMINS